MRLAVTGLLIVWAGTGFGHRDRTVSAQPEQIKLVADYEVKQGGTLKLRGHVQVISAAVTVYADEADYNPLTGNIDARGNVRIDLKKVTPKITIQNSTPEDLPVQPR